MGLFSYIFGGISDFFKEVAESFIGKAVDEMKDVAIQVVKDLEDIKDLDGSEKYEKAFEILVEHYPDARDEAINLAIESAVAVVKDMVKSD